MSNLLVQNIKHTNNTTAQTIDTSGRTTALLNNDTTYRSDSGAVTQNMVQGLAKSFIRCPDNGASITDSFNITSLTDNSTGRTTVIIANNMANANYSIAECTDENVRESWCDDLTTGQYDYDTYDGSNYTDIGKMSQTFGDLA
jgi:hypothetical protein